jgi:glycosyltransferase involved in cell wall biosynthesis
MKILVLAPHPFYQERGTPIAVNLLLRALSELGHTVDLLTFPEGDDVSHPRLTIHRLRAFGLIRGVRPGFSFKKLVLDMLMFFRAISLTARIRPDAIHAVEESVFIARVLNGLFRIPYLYDMDSSIPDQIIEKHAGLASWRNAMHKIFRRAVTKSLVVIPVCPALSRIARSEYEPQHLIELHDISLLDHTAEVPPLGLREKIGVRGLVFTYIGNLEHYQGVELLIEAFSLHSKRHHDDALVIIGGPNSLIDEQKELAARLGCDGAVHFLGPQPVAMQPSYFRETDVLVSPRLKGQNTPMKIYSYLDSGRPVLATRLYTHTQVVSDLHCMLCDPTPEQLSEGMRKLATSPDLRLRLAAEARILIANKHSYPAFRATVESIYNLVAETLEKKIQ